MKSALRLTLIAFACILLTGRTMAQIRATTEDGKKVLLNPDGTWRYLIEEIEKDSLLLKKLVVRDTLRGGSTLVSDTSVFKKAAALAIDSVKTPPPPPVVVRKPPNLDCTALLLVERSYDNEKWVGVLKRLLVSADGKTGFAISFYKTRHGPIMWTTHVLAPGTCIDANTKMTLILKNNTIYNFTSEGKDNCQGDFLLNFGGNSGKEDAFEMIKATDILAIRIWNSKFSADQYLHEYDAAIFRSSMNCLMNMK